MSGKCVVCLNDAYLKCSNCSKAFYCCKEHQAQDWKNGHSTECIPYKVKENKQFGRYLVAKRLIKQGEIIMKKQSLVLAPKFATYPVCLGCHKILNPNQDNYKCQKCKWPLCKKECEKHINHIKECTVWTKSTIVVNLNNNGAISTEYRYIGPLRVLLMETENKTTYNNIMEMQDHLDKLKKSSFGNVLHSAMLPTMQKVITTSSPDTIMKICSIFDTNSFDVRSKKHEINLRGLYPTVNLVAHDCTKNTCHYFLPEENFALVLMATVDIQKGDILTTTYTQTLWGTLERRLHLQKVKHFNCVCKRCRDETEYGVFVGCFYCQKCIIEDKNNDLEKPKLVSKNPAENASDWVCQKCGYEVHAIDISKQNNHLKSEIEQIDKSSHRGLEKFLVDYETILPPTNTFMLQTKYALVEIYGRTSVFDLPKDLLLKKIKYLDELLSVGQKLEPGLSEFNILLKLYKCEANSALNLTKERIATNLEDCKVLYAQAPKTEKIINVYNAVVQSLML